ncbi:MAG: hypothetical protein IKE85_07840 [Mogibacterium sp.]|nr:hypothetical protein [Mogibacterium sp.]
MAKHFKTDTTADSRTIKHTARRVFLILILILLGLFIFTERNSLQIKQRTDLYPVTDKTPTVAVSLLGNHTVTQKFIAKESLISSVKIRFNNPGRNTATGKVKLTLLDNKGAEVATTEIGADTINANKITRFILGGDSELANSNKIVQIVGTGYKTNIISVEKGKEYTLVMEAEDVGSEDVFELVMYTEDGFGSGKGEFSTTIDGTEQTGAWLNSVIYYRKLHTKILFLFAAMILFTALFVLIPFEKIDEKIPVSTWLSRIMLLLTPFAAYFIIQRFYGMGIGAFIKQVLSPIGALNLWIIVSVILIIYTITNRARFTIIFSTIIAALFGFTTTPWSSSGIRR